MQLHRTTSKLLAATMVLGTTASLAVQAGAAAAHAATTANATPVLLVHGFDGGDIFQGDVPLNSAVDCHNAVISAWKAGLQARGFTRVFTVGWYRGDTNCDLNIPNRAGITINTSITTPAMGLTNLIHNTFGTSNVLISAHSLGGIISRRALQGAEHAELGFSSDIHVPDVVASGSPHAGAVPSAICGTLNLFAECTQVAPGSTFLADLEANPQAGGRTRWSLVGSQCDTTVPAASAVAMARVSVARPVVAKTVFGAPSLFSGGCVFGSSAFSHADLVTKAAPLDAIRNGLVRAD